jgi:NitT/TauT family transport system substrate-binding protein
MNRRSALVLVVASASLGPAPARAQTLTQLKAVSGITLGARSALFADQTGLFRKNGLEVEIIPVTSGSAGLSAVVGNSAQVVYLNIITLLEAYDRGIGLQIIAPGSYYLSEKPYALMFVRKDSPVRTARDLNGKTIAVSSLKDINAIGMLNWVDQNGGDAKTIKMIEIPNASLMPVLDEGRVELITLLPPFQAQALDSGKYRVLGKPYDSIAKNFMVAAWVVTTDWVAKNADTARRFTLAMREASVAVNSNPGRSVDMVAAFTKVDPALVARSQGTFDPPYLEPRDLQPAIEASLKFGLIAKSFDAATLLNPAVRRPSGGAR